MKDQRVVLSARSDPVHTAQDEPVIASFQHDTLRALDVEYGVIEQWQTACRSPKGHVLESL